MDRGKSAGYSRFFPLICPSPPEFSRKFRCFCRLRRPISGQTLPRGDPNGPKTSRPAHLRRPPPGPGIAPVPGLQQRQHQKIPPAQRRNGCPRGRQLRRGEYAVNVDTAAKAANKSPPPGGGWPRRGRERNAGANPKVCTAYQTYCRVGNRTLLQVFRFSVIQHYRPNSSSVTNRFRRADWRQLPPGGSDQVLPHQCVKNPVWTSPYRIFIQVIRYRPASSARAPWLPSPGP